MKISRRRFVSTICASAATVMMALPAFADPIRINLADVLPDGNFMVQNAKRFAEEVAKETGGEVIINVRPGGSLGFKGPEQLRLGPSSLRGGVEGAPAGHTRQRCALPGRLCRAAGN